MKPLSQDSVGVGSRLALPSRPQLLVPLLLTLVASGACGPEERASSIHARWIEEEPGGLFEPETFLERVVHFEWRFDDPDEAAALDLVNQEGDPRTVLGGIEVPYRQPFVRLARAVDLQASEVHRIELEIDSAERGHVQLFWARGGESFSPDRKIQLPATSPSGGAVGFEVASNPNWSGTIERLMVTPTTAPDQTVVVKAIRGIQYRTNPDALGRVVAHPWKVELGEEVRNGLLAPPGVQLQKEFEVPRDGTFRFAYGIRPRPFVPIGFRVAVLAGDEEPAQLFEQWLDAGSEPG